MLFGTQATSSSTTRKEEKCVGYGGISNEVSALAAMVTKDLLALLLLTTYSTIPVNKDDI